MSSPSPSTVVLQSSHPSPSWADQGSLHSLLKKSSGEDNASAPAPVAEESPMSFYVLLRQNKAQLDAIFQAISDPKSPKYGHFLSSDQIKEIASPPVEEQAAVEDWLRQELLPEHSSDVHSLGDSVQVKNVSVAAVERAFGCKVHLFVEQLPAQSDIQKLLQRGSSAPLEPRVVQRCVGDITIPARFQGLITGTVGLVDMPIRPLHGGPVLHNGPRKHLTDAFAPVQQQAHTQAADTHSLSQQQAEAAAAALPSTHGHNPMHAARAVPLAHPHQTLRSTEQLQHITQQFEREQEARR